MSRSVDAGVGFPTLLALLFIGLKLAGKIDWSWVWVLAPLWVRGALWVLIAVTFVLFLWNR